LSDCSLDAQAKALMHFNTGYYSHTAGVYSRIQQICEDCDTANDVRMLQPLTAKQGSKDENVLAGP